MARGCIRKKARATGVAYEVVVTVGVDALTGRRKQQSRTYRTRREAERGLSTWLAEIERGTALDRSTVTVGEWLTEWLETVVRSSAAPTTFADYAWLCSKHILPELGGIPLQKLTPARLQAFYARKLAGGTGRATVEKCHAKISQALKAALRLGLVARNVAEATTPPRTPAREMQIWTAAECRRFLDAARGGRFGPLWLVMAATGLRRGEALGLRWQDVNWDSGTLTVAQSIRKHERRPLVRPPKSRSHRLVVTPATVFMELRAHQDRQTARRSLMDGSWQEHGLVFCADDGRPLLTHLLHYEYDKLIRQAGVPRIRIHDLRHTYATLALTLGVPIKVVSENLGHKDVAMTLRIYTHVMPPQRADLAARINQALFGPFDEAP